MSIVYSTPVATEGLRNTNNKLGDGTMRFSGTKGQAGLLRILAQHLGIRGCRAGWLMRNGKPICQGWAAFWEIACSRRWIVAYSGGTWVRRDVVCEGCRIDWRAVG